MWGGGNQWGQWPMDAAAYQNISHEQVDWATLAQQWIRMKEVHETAIVGFPVPVVQVAPIVHHVMAPQQPNVGYFTSEIHQEKGEAPMEVDKEEPEPSAESFSGPPVQWNQNTWTPPAANFAFPPAYPHPGYYTGPPRPPVMMQNAKVPPVPGAEEGSSLAAFAQGLDAAKRKQLPAWIREGLEKMERDKQKREEREKMLEERELKRQQSMKTSEDNEPYTGIIKSRFDDSESENEAADDDEPTVTEKFENLPDPQPQPIIKSPEEILHDAMMRIRRLMTEILLDVTSEEIQSIANEEYQRAVVKNRTRQSTTLGSKSLPKNLGLDYGSDSDADEDADETENQENSKKTDRGEDSDSDERLEEKIAEKKRLFALGQFDRDRRARIAEQEFHRWEKRLRGIVESSESEESEEEDAKVSNVVTTKVEVETGNVKIDPGSLAGKAAQNESGAKEKAEKPVDEPRRSRSTETASSKSKSDEKKRVGKDTKSRMSESSSEKRRSRSRDKVGRRSRSRSKDRARRRSRSRSRDRARRRSRSRSRDRERRRDSGRKRSRSRDSRRSRSKSRDRRKKRSRSRSRDRAKRSRSRSRDRARRSRSRERRRRRSSS